MSSASATVSSNRCRPWALVATALAVAALLAPGFGRSELAGKGGPAHLRVVQASPGSVTLGWNAEGARPRHAVFKGGRRIGTTRAASYTVSGLACSQTYVLSVAALDEAGRTSDVRTLTVAPASCPPREQRPPRPEHAPSEAETLPVEAADGSEATSLWHRAGAFVWHETDVAPEELAAELRAAGFGWVVLLVHDGTTVDPVEDEWVRRFREASGLPVGGWGVLRARPEQEAALAHELLDRYALDFYVANAEAEYKYSGDDGHSADRYQRSQRFVEAFRRLEPDTPAALSSYCRADMNDIDWSAWGARGFSFLPQAYVNDFGEAATPSACLAGSGEFFEAGRVHPTVGVYESRVEDATAARYADLLEAAGTVGFSLYLAETRMRSTDWGVLGKAIEDSKIAVAPTKRSNALASEAAAITATD